MASLTSKTPGTSFLLNGVEKLVADHSYDISLERLTIFDEDGNKILNNVYYGNITNVDEGRAFANVIELKSFLATAFGQSSPEDITAALANKVDKVAGKVLSTNDYTTAEKTKLSGVATGATANATDALLRDRSTHTGTQAISTVSGLQDALDSKQNA